MYPKCDLAMILMVNSAAPEREYRRCCVLIRRGSKSVADVFTFPQKSQPEVEITSNDHNIH